MRGRRQLAKPDAARPLGAGTLFARLLLPGLIERCDMKWVGMWHNQYGSTLNITDDQNGQVKGSFRTALQDSGFFGRECGILGVQVGDCVSFSFADSTPKGDMICAFTGMVRDGKLQTVWHVVSDATDSGAKRGWAHA